LCWTRSEKFFTGDDEKPDAWLTTQFKHTREQLDKQARLSDQLAAELRSVQADLEVRSGVAREARQLLGATNAELRAAAHASAVERAEHSEEAVALREHLEEFRLRAEAAEEREGLALCGARELEDLAETCAAEAAQLRERLCAEELASQRRADAAAAELGQQLAGAAGAQGAGEGELADLREACHNECVQLQEQRDRAVAELTAAVEAEAAACSELRAESARERELHEDTLRQLQALRAQGDEQVTELHQELKNLSMGLEQKEEDIMTIQFDMVELQNRFRDQAQLVMANADAFQTASEELADKDEKLETALQRQEELLAQMNVVSTQLQDKVSELSQELEGSRAAYQALDDQTRTVVARLESDRDALAAELERVRAEANAETAALRAKLQRQEEAAEGRCASFELELRAARANAEADRAAQELRHLSRQSSLTQQLEQTVERGSAERRALEAELSRQEAAGRRSIAELQRAHQKVRAGSIEERAAAEEATKVEAERARELQEKLVDTTEQLNVAEAQLMDLTAALERSRLLERQSFERAKDYRNSWELHSEFGKEGFSAAAPRTSQLVLDRENTCGTDVGDDRSEEGLPASSPVPASTGASTPCCGGAVANGGSEQPAVPSVLIAAELDLGKVAGTAVLSVAPWQTRSDFDAVVRDFLEQHRVRPVFANALVRFLEEVEAEASTFPTIVKAELTNLYSRFG